MNRVLLEFLRRHSPVFLKENIHLERADVTGLPFRGDPNKMLEEPPLRFGDFHVKIFKIPEDLEEYRFVQEQIVNGICRKKTEKLFIEVDGKLCHYLEWVQVWEVSPEEIADLRGTAVSRKLAEIG